MNFLRIAISFAVLMCLSIVSFGQEIKLTFKIENRGDFVMTLYPKAAPKTVAHIVGLAEKGFYDGQKFHRSEKKPRPYLVQVGDPATKDGFDSDRSYKGGTGARIPFELNDLQNDIGAVGLAREPEDKDSGDSQFYILLSSSRFLNGKFTVFGAITNGMDVVQKIDRGDKIVSVKVQKG